MEVRLPNKKLLREASHYARDGTKDCITIALALRPKGVTQQEVIQLLGHPHRNIIKKLVGSRSMKQVYLPDASRARRIRLSPRGK